MEHLCLLKKQKLSLPQTPVPLGLKLSHAWEVSMLIVMMVQMTTQNGYSYLSFLQNLFLPWPRLTPGLINDNVWKTQPSRLTWHLKKVNMKGNPEKITMTILMILTTFTCVKVTMTNTKKLAMKISTSTFIWETMAVTAATPPSLLLPFFFNLFLLTLIDYVISYWLLINDYVIDYVQLSLWRGFGQ